MNTNNKLARQLLAAANYIDILGGDSKNCRQALVDFEAHAAEQAAKAGPAGPAGFKLVPLELTPKMREALLDNAGPGYVDEECAPRVWAAMLAAEPTPTSPEADDLARERASRQDAQRQLDDYKGRLARARLDLQRELREQGWTPPDAQTAPDAERYRWIKDPCRCYHIEIQSQPRGDTVFSGGGCSNRDGLDAAIDAEIAMLHAASPKALCDCGKKPADECDKWEPGCDLGRSPEHVRVVRLGEAQAAPEAQQADPSPELKRMTAGQELPPLPSHPEPRTMTWTALEARVIAEYGKACARAALAQRREPLTDLALLGAYEAEQAGSQWGAHLRGVRAVEAACAESWGVKPGVTTGERHD